MTVAPHASKVHQMVDRLAPAQIEALYVILRGMIGRVDDHDTAGAAGHAPGDTAPQHRFAFIGIMDGEPDLAERSASILREELGTLTE